MNERTNEVNAKNCLLVNKWHPITQEQIDQIKMIKIGKNEDGDVLVEEKTLEAFGRLCEEMKKQGFPIGITSAFRTFAQQEKVYEDIARSKGIKYAESHVAKPTESEHHTGMAIDVKPAAFIANIPLVNRVYPKDLLFAKLSENLSKFGFILRYPEGKEEKTGVDHERWHIRYVGEPIAEIISKNNITLEEFVENQDKYLLSDFNNSVCEEESEM